MPRPGQKIIAVYVTDSQADEIKNLAKENGMSISKFILSKILESKKKTKLNHKSQFKRQGPKTSWE